MNDFKEKLFLSTYELQQCRLFIQQDQLRDFWQSKTMIEMENILTIRDQTILQTLTYYLSLYLSEKIVAYTQAYTVSKANKILLQTYDCKLFKNKSYQKEDNEFLCSLLIAYQHAPQITQMDTPIHQFIDISAFQKSKAILKVKSSCLTRLYSLISSCKLEPLNTDIIIIPQSLYSLFIQRWICCEYSYGIELNVHYLFKGIFFLLQNKMLLQFFGSLSEYERYERQNNRPIKKIKKPKNKQQFTMPQKRFGEIQWHKLKIQTFKLHYKVIEKEDQYQCYRRKNVSHWNKQIDFNQLTPEDRNILLAFHKENQENNYQTY